MAPANPSPETPHGVPRGRLYSGWQPSAILQPLFRRSLMKSLFESFRLPAAFLMGAALLLALIAVAVPVSAQATKPTVEDARKFLADASARLFDLTVESARSPWL